ncbi:MAG TPA: FAD-binding oxidoreductase [Candidatus Acidoferrales bacterium]|nr:FAD-binding oxidoreductase [Candidatus Acidoferrales bacterium]
MKKVLLELRSFLKPAQLSTSEPDLISHAKDRSFHQASRPDIVIWPNSTKDISNIVKFANKYKIPLTVRGGGSSLEGNPIPVFGGIVLDMTKMNKILKVYQDDLEVRIQPGIIGEELDALLKPYGLWFAAAPGSKHLATIGGMIANNAGGMHAVKYGVVNDAVLQLEVVLANGDIIRIGSRSYKTVSGYNLKSLIIGSEGTLGIVTEAVLKLTPLPEAKIATLVSFQTNDDAAKANLAILNTSIKPASLEFMDKTYVTLVNKAEKAKLNENPTLLIELHGKKNILLEQLNEVKDICKKNKALSFEEFTTPEDLIRLWQYRRAVRPVLSTLLPNQGVLSAEIGVPISQIPKFLKKAEEVSKKYNLQTVMFGHMGDGNFHGWALYELNNEESWEKVTKLNEELVKYAISVDGTTTGEHGLGIGKSKFLPIEHPTGMPIMKQIKQLLDPNNILNPGKMFPEE